MQMVSSTDILKLLINKRIKLTPIALRTMNVKKFDMTGLLLQSRHEVTGAARDTANQKPKLQRKKKSERNKANKGTRGAPSVLTTATCTGSRKNSAKYKKRTIWKMTMIQPGVVSASMCTGPTQKSI